MLYFFNIGPSDDTKITLVDDLVKNYSITGFPADQDTIKVSMRFYEVSLTK